MVADFKFDYAPACEILLLQDNLSRNLLKTASPLTNLKKVIESHVEKRRKSAKALTLPTVRFFGRRTAK